MLKIYRTDNNKLHEVEKFDPGVWVCLTAPSDEECLMVAEQFDVDISDVRAALDEEESSRVDIDNEYSLILFDIPTIEYRHEREAYTTIPLGLILVGNILITVCGQDTPVLKPFMENRVREFSTKKHVRFLFQIFWRACLLYQSYLRTVDRRRKEIEEHISDEMKEVELIDLHELESNLVYFDTSLRANKVVLERLLRYNRFKKYPEDEELLDDVVIENSQAIEMTKIYRDIMKGTRELLSAIMDKRLNNTMKNLASITIIMAIPTIISGIYGMNVNSAGMPLAKAPFGFGIICLLMLMCCLIAVRILKKKKML